MPPRFSRSRITRVISLVPPGTVKSSDGSGRRERLGLLPFFGGRGMIVSSALASTDPPLPSTRNTPSSAEPMLVGFDLDPQPLARRRPPGRIGRSSPGGSMRPLSTDGCDRPRRRTAAGSAASRISG